MGVDLTLVPVVYPNVDWILAYTRIEMRGRWYGLWECLTKLSKPLNHEISWYGDEGIKKESETPYGKPLTWVTAEQFIKAVKIAKCKKDMVDLDKAAVAYVRALPPDMKIILWFH